MQNLTLPEKIVILVVVSLVLLLGCGGYYLFLRQEGKTSSSISELSPQALMDAVSKIAELPPEQPTIATVTDKDKLSHFSFFSQAQIGDRVLIFNEAKKAYLYRPATNKIVEVGPIMIAQDTTNAEQIPSAQPEEGTVAAVQDVPATVTLLNGTKGKGVASAAEKVLEKKELNIEVKTRGNTKKDYTQTKISLTNQDVRSIAEQIAEVFDAEIVDLPAGEATPKTDIVVFLGTDRL